MHTCGFQSESKITTVSAVARLIPSPPARVERRKINFSEPGQIRDGVNLISKGRG